MTETVAKTDQNPVTIIGEISSTDKQIIDNPNADGHIYIGYARKGTATSASSWFIEKIASGNPQIITHSSMTAVWDDRTSETYT